ncbi:MAG: DUF3131 domain-containing protein [Clostridia bacterium]|nr:DUF3131 domain-containing protein [Clostridia bacterium]
MPFPFFPSARRLQAPMAFQKRLFRLMKHPAVSRENTSGALQAMADDAAFLHNRFLSLRRELNACPLLPFREKVPRLLSAARQIISALPLTPGGILRTFRACYEDAEPLTREIDYLSQAIACALFEKLSDTMEKAMQPMDEAAALQCHQETALLIQALHALPRLPMDTLQEHLSAVAQVLRKEETYRRMDRESRRYYIACVCHIARKWNLSETAVARAALTLTEGKEGAEKEAGYYLTEQPEKIAAYLMKTAFPKNFRRKTIRYLLPLFLSAGLFALLFFLLKAPVLLFPFAVLAFSEHTRCLYYRLLRRLYPPRMLPRLQKRYIEKERLLVVVPTLLTDEKQALQMARQLQILRAATPHAHFMLLGDFADSAQHLSAEDEDTCRMAAAAVEEMNRQKNGTFYYLHRQRRWDEKQQLFTGRERKRGALEALNLLLTGAECPDEFFYASHPLNRLKNAYDTVITLDADTFLPPGAAAKLQGALAHPLQKGRINVIQPRMATLQMDIRTRTQAFFTSSGAVDSYHTFVQNVYQDVFGRGSFTGKGIYRPAEFLAATKEKLPSGRILSHDLIEGELAGAAMAEDIVLFDTQPTRVSGWQKRLHRWTRGDWQLLPFLKDTSLSLLSRWKIYDNLRSSLVPLSEMILMLVGALLQNPFLMLLGLPYPFRGLLRRLITLPGKALTQLDAACRAVYRLFISRKNLLSWVTASQAESSMGLNIPSTAVMLASGLFMLILSLLPGGVLPALIPGALWLVSPLLVPFMDQPKRTLPELTEEEKESVRVLCRDTWHFFEKHVHSRTFFLPPDNVQLNPEKGPALRTSPTNIGLYLLSALAAREMGIITSAQMARRMLDTVETLEKMEKWQGHLYNWYDLNTLNPLSPKFVSTVDSGNLCGCLMACAQGVRAHLTELGDAFHSLPERLDHLAKGMNFRKLYDPDLSLFFIGFDAEANTHAPSHYDLLASECRLTSFIAVMQRQVPLKHWFSLGRQTVRRGGGAALISWGGTAFEYLMPLLLMPLYPNTLLHDGCTSAVRAQIAHEKNRPFGISESGYYAFDTEMQYQYRTFGLPSLSLSGRSGGHVIAPYASMLALPFFPRAAIRNLKWMRRLSWYSEDGLYEAADYTPTRLEQMPRLVESHMAHHQGMILCAGCNLLTSFSLVRHFMQPAAARAYSYLLCEGKQSLPPLSPALPALPPPSPSVPDFRWTAKPMDAHALSGSGTCWLINHQGNGVLLSHDRLWTRFFPDAPCGPQFYLRNVQTGACIRPQAQGNLLFENGCVRMPLHAFHTEGEMRFFVLPLNGHAVADIRLTNRNTLDAELEVISFLETARTGYFEDAAHPHFRDLSILTEPFGDDGILCRRLSDKVQPLLLHRLLGPVQSLRRQGDRLLFLGRKGTYDSPEQTTRPAEKCRFRTGATIAPCLSLRGLIRLRPGESVHLQFITAEYALEADIPPNRQLLPEAALMLAAEKAAMTLQFLQIKAESIPLYMKMQGALCFGTLLSHGTQAAPSLDSLWRNGISGREPLCTVYLKEADKPLIRHALLSHILMEESGVKTVLLFVCDEGAEKYLTPVQTAVREVMDSLHGCRERIVITAGKEAEAIQIKPMSRLYLKSGAPLSEQLAALPAPPHSAPVPPAGAAPLPPPLACQNPCGGFTEEGDYCIFAPTPAPWHNLLIGQRFGTLVCENAILHSFCDNSHLNRFTRKAADVHRPECAEMYTLSDDEGHAFSLTGGLCFHQPGVTEYHSLPLGVKAKLTLCSHPERPSGLRLITLQAEENRSLTLTCTLHFARNCLLHKRPGQQMILAQSIAFPGCAFVFMPEGEEASIQNNTVVLRCRIFLGRRKSQSIPLYLGWAQQEEEAVCLAAALLQQSPAGFLRSTQVFWQQQLEKLLLFGAAPWLCVYMNRWLPYQTLSARLMGRTGPYQDGGAFGFRDQLQDLLCCLHTQPEKARDHLLLFAAHQFPEGDVQHWWHPPRTGVRTRISDDKLFLPFLAAVYVQITGDEAILSEQVPFLLSPPLKENEHDRYETPEISRHTASLMEHCLLAIASVNLGSHGIPLMGSGDWNDGMDKVEGESVWLGFFLCLVYRMFSPLCSPETAQKYMQKRTTLLTALESAWTGQWYLRAWYKDGEPLAGPHTHPPRIDLITQAFACLAGAPRDHARQALSQAVQKLYKQEDGMVLLLDPPFTPVEKAGYIGHYVPGVRENGGQYTHAVPWLIMALCNVGESRLAWQMARDILPLFHTDTEEKLRRYRLEPYVLCGDVYAGENRGRGGWSWYTGSAAWLYYAILTHLLGFEKRGNKVRLVPCPMENAEEFTLVYQWENTAFHLTASPDVPFATLDGEKLKDGWAALVPDHRTHEMRFPWRKV